MIPRTVVLYLPGQGERGFSPPDRERPQLVHTRAGLTLPLDRILFEAERQGRRVALLLGEAGSGKSGFLDQVAGGRHLPEGLDPVRLVVGADGAPAVPAASLQGARRLLVLDGLERLDAPQCRRLGTALRAALDGKDLWLIASRFDGHDLELPSGLAAEFHLRPLEHAQRPELVRATCVGFGLDPEPAIRTLLAREWLIDRALSDASGYPGQLASLCRAWAAEGRLPHPAAAAADPPPAGVPATGAQRVDPRTGIAFARIPGGAFVMGSADTEPDRWADEGPRHPVQVPAFELAITPTTNLQYQRYLRARPTAGIPAYWGDRRFNGDQQPVVGIGWEDAQEFAAWAGARLPSEAEWEYACRAGVDQPRYGELDRIAWWIGNSGGRLQPVATRLPNAFGLYDMLGNVWEYVEDDRHDDYRQAPSDGSAWIDRPRGEVRLLRGGTWADAPRVVRCTTRLTHHPGPRVGSVGFRVARSVAERR